MIFFKMSIYCGSSLIQNIAMASYLVLLLLLSFLMKQSHLSQSYLFKNYCHKYIFTIFIPSLVPNFLYNEFRGLICPFVFYFLPTLLDFYLTPLSFVLYESAKLTCLRVLEWPFLHAQGHYTLCFSLSLFPFLPSFFYSFLPPFLSFFLPSLAVVPTLLSTLCSCLVNSFLFCISSHMLLPQ